MEDNQHRPQFPKISLHKTVKPGTLILLFIYILFSIWLIVDSINIPFHPDESTQLFMSNDFEQLFTQPLQMAWAPPVNGEESLVSHYRLLDAPITRYLLGLGSFLTGQPPQETDWDWSKTWVENQAEGALPTQSALSAGRVMISILLPISIIMLFLIGSRTQDIWTGIFSAFLLGFNGLVLLHCRRAMAEGASLFGVIFLLTCLISHRKGWLVGLAFAFAFNSKQSTAALLPVCILALLWPISLNDRHLGAFVKKLASFAISSVFITFLLNPFMWKYPIQAVQTALTNRLEFMNGQVVDYSIIAPQKVLETPSERITTFLLEAFIAPPSFSESGNYLQQTQISENEYLSNPIHTALRGLVAGTILLVLSLFGGIFWIRDSFAKDRQNRRAIILVSLAFVFQFGGLVATVPLDFQRYIIPIIPYTILGAGYGIARLSKPITTHLSGIFI